MKVKKVYNALEYIKSDYFRYTNKNSNFVKLILYTFRNKGFAYSFYYRMVTRAGGVFFTKFFWLWKLYRTQRRTGIQIGRHATIGYGFYIGHGDSVIISSYTTIGNNCNVSQFLSIGTNEEHGAIIGDNVYIGPNVCIVEDPVIGNNVTIGAGSVVTKDIPDNATAVGCPAKVINYNNPGRYIGNRWTQKTNNGIDSN